MSIIDTFRILPPEEDMTVTYHMPKRGSWDVSDKTPVERLIMLRDFLRTPVPNKHWDFSDIAVNPECGSAGCACGWYMYLTDKYGSLDFGTSEMLDEFGMNTYEEFEGIFDNGLTLKLSLDSMSDVSPENVADAIDEHLTKLAFQDCVD